LGEAAELVLDGVLCSICGCLIDGEITGYPRQCEECED
jgi:hypothetical protein